MLILMHLLHNEWIYNSCLNFSFRACEIYFMFMSVTHTWMAVRAATMAGDPKPWVMREKCVRCLWMFWSRIIAGFVLQSGERSWFKRSISSLVTILKKKFRLARFEQFEEFPTLLPAVNLSVCTAHWGPGTYSKGIPLLAARGIRFRRHSQNLWLNVWLHLQFNNKN